MARQPRRQPREAKRETKNAPQWIGGKHCVQALLQETPQKIVRLCFARSNKESSVSFLNQLAQQQKIVVEQCHLSDLDQRAGEHHQGVAALATLPKFKPESFLEPLLKQQALPLLLILDRVSDPRNFGACLRTAEACRVTSVIIPAHHSSPMTPVTVRASAGAALRVPIVCVSNLARCMKNIGDLGVWIAGMGGEGKESIYSLNCCVPMAFVCGSEGLGLRRLTRDSCDHHVSIPIWGQVESLNVSVAAAICLYEACRQRLNESAPGMAKSPH